MSPRKAAKRAPDPAGSPAALEADWAARVRANREQAERVSEVKAGDFYAPVSSLFVAVAR